MIADLWIIVLTWNDRIDTAELLASLAQAELHGAHLLVVDNGSEPSVLDGLQLEFPWISTLQNGANLGYAGGNNRGADFAIRQGARYICFLNNDTVVSPDFVSTLSTALGEPDERVAVSPAICYYDDRNQIWFGGVHVEPALGSPVHTAVSIDSLRPGQPTELLTGCCLAMATGTWRLVGSFDESLFLIFEDSDWSMRARSAGVKLAVTPNVVVAHKVSRSFSGDREGIGYFYFVRNGLTFARRWLPRRAALRFLSFAVARPVGREAKAGHALRALRKLALAGAAITAQLSRHEGEAGRVVTAIARLRKQG